MSASVFVLTDALRIAAHWPLREETMKKFSIAAVVAASFVAPAFADGHLDKTGWPESFTVGTASQGGTYFAYGSGWANLVAEELGLTGGGEVTGGPMQNMALVHTGDAQFGMTTMGPAKISARHKPDCARSSDDQRLRDVPNVSDTVQRHGAVVFGITSIADIPAGAKIGFGPAGSTSDTYFPRMMETLGVDFERRNGGWTDLGGQLQDGLLDVIAFAAGVPVPAVSQLDSD